MDDRLPAASTGPGVAVAPVVAPRSEVRRWPLAGRAGLLAPAVILLAYAVPLLILPPTHPYPLIDDWNYLISVRRLVEESELWVAPWTAATLVLQIGWGALFAWPFGVEPEVLRASTLVASLGGTLACHALFRELGAARPRALIGALAVWFNPIAFGLSYTFMTDVPFMALLSGAAFAIVRAVRRGSVGWLAAGSAIAGLAFLIRQQGALLPLATLGWLLLARPLWARARPWRVAAALLGPCLAAVALYGLWAAAAGLPSTQGDYVASLRAAGLRGTFDLVWQLAVVAIFYLGLFVLPLTVGAVGALPGIWVRAGWPVRHAAVVGLLGMALWTRWFAATHDGRTFPFVPWGSILGHDGFGILDADGERPFVFAPWHYATLSLVCSLSAVAALLLIAGRRRVPDDAATGTNAPSFLRSEGGLLLLLGLGQFAGTVPPSLHIRQMITFDRYFLPLLPFALGLVLWTLRDRRFSFPAPVATLALLAVVGILGAQDWFAFKRSQWETADWLIAERGVPVRQVDGAAQWDGMRWYEYHLAHPDDRLPQRPDAPWWLHLIAPMIDARYIVAASPETREGYEVWMTRPYDSWFRSEDEALIYVWRRLPERPAPALPPVEIKPIEGR